MPQIEDEIDAPWKGGANFYELITVPHKTAHMGSPWQATILERGGNLAMALVEWNRW
jgi:hypothetical protein